MELDKPPKAAKRKFIQADDAAAFAEAALRYLDRYDTTKAGLKRLLERKLDPSLTPTERGQARAHIEALLLRLESSKVLDDARYAANLTQSLRARGASARGIAQKLRQRGVDPDATPPSPTSPDDELSAARRFAKKKRLVAKHFSAGPEGRNKALGALARQGFSFEVARRALELEAKGALDCGDESDTE